MNNLTTYSRQIMYDFITNPDILMFANKYWYNFINNKILLNKNKLYDIINDNSHITLTILNNNIHICNGCQHFNIDVTRNIYYIDEATPGCSQYMLFYTYCKTCFKIVMNHNYKMPITIPMEYLSYGYIYDICEVLDYDYDPPELLEDYSRTI
jgi:hypothetical protein